ncbi:MAG: hypothetical protein QXI17_04015 [Candidatus Bilamarchaeaceae archaeon]
MANKKHKHKSKKIKKPKKNLIKKAKTAVVIPVKENKKKTDKQKKDKKKLPTKKSIKVKEEKENDVYTLTAEEMQKINELLARPIVRQTLIEVGGENALAIIKNFDKALSDEDIAKRLKIKISDVRAALNILHSEGIVMYNRYKDNDTGWYSYSWYLNKNKIFQWVEEKTKKFGAVTSNNSGEYYICPFCGVSTIISFETAIDRGFKCEICGKPLEFLNEELMQKLGIVETKTFVRIVK